MYFIHYHDLIYVLLEESEGKHYLIETEDEYINMPI